MNDRMRYWFKYYEWVKDNEEKMINVGKEWSAIVFK